jgi:periplasmic copper chaperone A
MRFTHAVGVLIVMCGLVVIGQTSAGHIGHRHTTIQLENAWARRAPSMVQGGQRSQGGGAMTSGNGAVYVTISNHGSEADALLAASTDVANTVELHATGEQDGKMVMRPLSKFDVPAGGKLEMKPGGYHIMLLGLKQDLKSGETLNVGFSFEKAGQMSVEAPVK